MWCWLILAIIFARIRVKSVVGLTIESLLVLIVAVILLSIIIVVIASWLVVIRSECPVLV